MIHAQMAQLPSFRSFPTSKCIPSSKWFTTRVEQIIHNPLETGIFHIMEVYCYTVILCCPIANYLVVSSNWESCSSFGLSILCVGWKGLSKSIGQSSFSLLKVPFWGAYTIVRSQAHTAILSPFRRFKSCSIAMFLGDPPFNSHATCQSQAYPTCLITNLYPNSGVYHH